MNQKQFIILIVLLAILGGSGWYIQQGRNHAASEGEQGTGGKLMGDSFQINDVAQIHIVQGTNEVSLVKKQDLWRVAERKDYPANFSSISDFLIKLRDIKVVQKDEVGDADLARLQLSAPGHGTNSGTLLEFKNADGKVMTSLLLGKMHMGKPNAQQQQFGMGAAGFPDGRYVQAGGNGKVAYLIADALASIEPRAADWLNKDFFKVERPKSLSVSYAMESNSWGILRDSESGEWKLADAKGEEKLDTARASSVSTPFASPSFDEVAAPSSDVAKYGLDKPTLIKIETFDDFVYNIKVGEKTEEKYPITISVAANFPKERIPAKDEKPEDKSKADKAWGERQKQLDAQLAEAKHYENWIYLVPTWTVDTLLKERKDILVEKKDAPKSGDAGEPVKPEALK